MRGFFTGLLVGGALIGLLCFPIREYGAHGILSDSMRPSIRAGSVVITRRMPPAGYRVGDVVTFYSPEDGVLVTHRITSLFITAAGAPAFTSKGDGNTNGDLRAQSLGTIRGRVVFSVP